MKCAVSRSFGIFLASLGILLLACSNSVQEISEAEDCPLLYSILAVFAPNGLGDKSYNDNIYRSLREIAKEQENVAIESYTPVDMDDAKGVVQRWIEEGKAAAVKNFVSKRMLLLTDASFYEILRDNESLRNSGNDAILWLDSSNPDSMNVYSRYISLYGVSYLAGQIVHGLGVQKASAVLANPNIEALSQSLAGFSDGFRSAGGKFDSTDVHYLSNNISGGFDESDSLYRLSYRLDSLGYGFVFPMAGGSNAGLLRYTREQADTNMFLTCGVDVDQQDYSQNVAFSIVKRMDLIVKNFIGEWMDDMEMDLSETYSILDNFVDIVVADGYDNAIGKYVSERNEAAEAEMMYYGALLK